jgi:hypothetical protein
MNEEIRSTKFATKFPTKGEMGAFGTGSIYRHVVDVRGIVSTGDPAQRAERFQPREARCKRVSRGTCQKGIPRLKGGSRRSRPASFHSRAPAGHPGFCLAHPGKRSCLTHPRAEIFRPVGPAGKGLQSLFSVANRRRAFNSQRSLGTDMGFLESQLLLQMTQVCSLEFSVWCSQLPTPNNERQTPKAFLV